MCLKQLRRGLATQLHGDLHEAELPLPPSEVCFAPFPIFFAPLPVESCVIACQQRLSCFHQALVHEQQHQLLPLQQVSTCCTKLKADKMSNMTVYVWVQIVHAGLHHFGSLPWSLQLLLAHVMEDMAVSRSDNTSIEDFDCCQASAVWALCRFGRPSHGRLILITPRTARTSHSCRVLPVKVQFQDI